MWSSEGGQCEITFSTFTLSQLVRSYWSRAKAFKNAWALGRTRQGAKNDLRCGIPVPPFPSESRWLPLTSHLLKRCHILKWPLPTEEDMLTPDLDRSLSYESAEWQPLSLMDRPTSQTHTSCSLLHIFTNCSLVHLIISLPILQIWAAFTPSQIVHFSANNAANKPPDLGENHFLALYRAQQRKPGGESNKIGSG